MSFECPECHFKNTEIQPAGEIQPKGARFSLKVESADDLNRQIVKSDTCVFRLEELDLEIPPGRGQLTNVEGILSMVASDLGEQQEARKEVQPEIYEKIQGIIDTLKAMAEGQKFPFRVVVDDPAGNSWIEPSTEIRAGKYSRHNYKRTPEQNASLGLAATSNGDDGTQAPDTEIRPEYQAQHMYPEMPDAGTRAVNNVDAEDEIVENQVYSFPASCPDCMKAAATNMKMVNIPHFKQVVIMATVCDHCGYKTNEVKTGGAVPEKGRRITIEVKNTEDLSRDILKSESCALSVPEIGLSVEPGSQGGRFTTIEGLLTQCRDDLRKSRFGDADGPGDSMSTSDKEKWEKFFNDMDDAISGRIPFTMVLQDPLAGSYVQSFSDDGGPDAQMKVEEYERTEEEEEDLGLRDIQVDGYEGDPNAVNGS